MSYIFKTHVEQLVQDTKFVLKYEKSVLCQEKQNYMIKYYKSITAMIVLNNWVKIKRPIYVNLHLSSI